MTETIHYRDDVEWPLNPDGKAKLEAEGVMHSPTVYDPEVHHIDPEKLNPALGEQQFHVALDVMLRRSAIRAKSPGHGIPCFQQGIIMAEFGIDNPEKGAESVRADDPAEHLSNLRRWLADNRTPLRPVFTPNPSWDFSRGPLPVAAAMDMLPFYVSPSAFAVKYYYGLARPEQIVARTVKNEVEVPHWFEDEIARMGITADNYQDWFQYGHPPHPRFIAMHSAVARCAAAAFVFYDMSEAQLHAVSDFERNVAHNRDNGGVHTFDDSSEGLRGGLWAVKAVLPEIVGKLGGDVDYVKMLLELIPETS